MRAGAKHVFIISAAAVLIGCGSTTATNGGVTPTTTNNSQPSGEKALVFFSQANSQDPWRQVFDAETKDAAERQKNVFDFQEQQADDDPVKQIGQVETALVSKPKVLMISPATVALQKAIEEAHDRGVYVIVLDRSVPGTKWDVYVGGDNHAIGVQAADYMGKKLNGKGTILMIQGKADAQPTKDRANGFLDTMARSYPGIKIIKGNNCDYQRAPAQTYMENFLQSKQPFDAVYAHNDEMAIGAYLAMQSAHVPPKMIVGIDGCQKEVMQMIKDGKLEATFSYPDPGPKGIEIAAQAVNSVQQKSKKFILQTTLINKDTVDKYMSDHPNLAGPKK